MLDSFRRKLVEPAAHVVAFGASLMPRFVFGRPMWRQIHRWIGLGAALLIVSVTLSGLVLSFGADIDRMLSPVRYAVTGAAAGQSADVYLANAVAAASGSRVVALRWPRDQGAPVTALLRGGDSPEQARVAYVDPRTGYVLDVADFRGGFVGFVHSLHSSLLAPNFSGRQIVGWIGVSLLAMVLSGLWLWRRRSAGLLQLLRWRRGPQMSFNLHLSAGFWIAGPLAVMALTGIAQGFPPQARTLIGVFSNVAPQTPRRGAPMQKPAQDAARVVELALQNGAGLKPVSLTLPTQQAKVWRLDATDADGAARTVLIDDATGAATVEAPAQGDAFLAWMHRVHEGLHHGPVLRLIVILCGLAPALFFATGVLMWLRRRRSTASAIRSSASFARGEIQSAASDLRTLEP